MNKLAMGKKLLLKLGSLSAVALPVLCGWLSAGSPATAQDETFLPIVKVAPVYPPEAAEIHLEGYVIVEFTVTETGSVEDLIVVESSALIFEETALDAASKFKYQPRTINGTPVAVPGVRNRFTYVLDEDDFVLESNHSLSEPVVVRNAQ